jgi:hypothetical protein
MERYFVVIPDTDDHLKNKLWLLVEAHGQRLPTHCVAKLITAKLDPSCRGTIVGTLFCTKAEPDEYSEYYCTEVSSEFFKVLLREMASENTGRPQSFYLKKYVGDEVALELQDVWLQVHVVKTN